MNCFNTNTHKTGIIKLMTNINHRTYIAIDLKSFYASVECVERGLDPLNTNLVVADEERSEKTICLAVSPSLKTLGIPGRARLFEVIQKVNKQNRLRQKEIHWKDFKGKSYYADELQKNPYLEIDYVIAKPRMSFYMEYSTRIYQIYLKYIAPEDIHVYSIDEVFIDVTDYLHTYQKNAHELAMMLIQDVLKTTGITATAGIGTNLYLAKVAMDIVAKHIPADKDGVRIAELDEMRYRELLWSHRPLTDFWRVGRGYAKKLEENGLYTMGDIARCSLGKENAYHNEALLYQLFGINAELLIDHAWGYEPCTMKDIKAYKPSANSLGSGQVLSSPYDFEKTKLIVKEKVDNLVLDLIEKHLVSDSYALTISYDSSNLSDEKIHYQGEVTTDFYGKDVPKHAHGTIHLKVKTASLKIIQEEMMKLFDRIVNPKLTSRRIYVGAFNVIPEQDAKEEIHAEQMDLFTHNTEPEINTEDLQKEQHMQEAILKIKKKYGKNAIMKGMNLEDGATAKERNEMIGGHKS